LETQFARHTKRLAANDTRNQEQNAPNYGLTPFDFLTFFSHPEQRPCEWTFVVGHVPDALRPADHSHERDLKVADGLGGGQCHWFPNRVTAECGVIHPEPGQAAPTGSPISSIDIESELSTPARKAGKAPIAHDV
jgi:hypothetical protein